MAMVACPECGKQVSSTAPACPGCGAPVAKLVQRRDMPPAYLEERPKAQWWTCAVGGLIAVLVVVFFLLRMPGSEQSAAQSQTFLLR